MKQKGRYRRLWGITGIAVIGLLVATLFLAYRAFNMPVTGLEGSITGLNPTIYLREEPTGRGKIVTILERGHSVVVIDVTMSDGASWLKVDSGRFSGWVPATNVAFNTP